MAPFGHTCKSAGFVRFDNMFVPTSTLLSACHERRDEMLSETKRLVKNILLGGYIWPYKYEPGYAI